MLDPQLLRQVVLNLVSNAIKYTPHGGHIDIRIGCDGVGSRWSIRDSGIGIPKAGQARLFEKFFRADNVHTIDTEGTGLGLYLVRLIVERFGGTVAFESEEGHGSLFSFTLPLATGDPS
jgi:two-component system phosphate regulon sensor histidine kinase PhoR